MPYKILVVDDDKMVRKLFMDLLKKENHIVKAASSGEEALALLNKEPFDAALLDIKLKGMSGLDTLKEIKDKYPQTIVIMITGFGYDEDLVLKSNELGCSGYLSKDLDLNQIMENLKNFISKAREK